jgi:hypothetical protein
MVDRAVLVQFFNIWIDYQHSQGTIDECFDYWIRGRAFEEKEPRWSIGRNVMACGRNRWPRMGRRARVRSLFSSALFCWPSTMTSNKV